MFGPVELMILEKKLWSCMDCQLSNMVSTIVANCYIVGTFEVDQKSATQYCDMSKNLANGPRYRPRGENGFPIISVTTVVRVVSVMRSGMDRVKCRVGPMRECCVGPLNACKESQGKHESRTGVVPRSNCFHRLSAVTWHHLNILAMCTAPW